MGLIYIGGVNGVGKTSIAQAFARQESIRMLNGSTELMKYLGIPGNYDQLRRLPESVKEQALTTLFEDLALTNSEAPTVITGHYVKVLCGTVNPTYGPWYKHCSLLVLVISPPHSILRRIARDEITGARVGRRLFGSREITLGVQIRMLERAQRMSLAVMHRATREFGVPSLSLENKDDHLSDAVKRLTNFVKRRS